MRDTIENLENYESQAVGDNKDTYRQIFEGVQELKKLLDSNASRTEIQKKLKELSDLAAKLPAKKPEKPPAKKKNR